MISHVKLTVNLGEIPEQSRYLKCLEIFDSLAGGESMVVIDAYDLSSLFKQFAVDRESQFIWKTLEHGPIFWRAYIFKVDSSNSQ